MKILISIAIISILSFPFSLAMTKEQEEISSVIATDLLTVNLDKCANINTIDKQGFTPLMCAADKGHKEVVALLLDKGADINAKAVPTKKSGCYYSALMMPTTKSRYPSTISKDGFTPLMFAADKGHKEVVALLLDRGANINAASEGNFLYTALMIAAGRGYSEIVNLLLARGADVNASNSIGHTALTIAAGLGHKEIVPLLLKNGAYISQGKSALIYAAEEGNKEVVQLLIELGANVNAQCNWTWNALIGAAIHGHSEIVLVLLEKGAIINAQTDNGSTVLLLAAQHGQREVVALLLDKGADINHENHDNSTALLEATKSGHTDIVALLLEKGSDVNTQNYLGDTALIWAANQDYKEIMALLIKKNSDINAKNTTNGTALTLAKRKETPQLLELCSLSEVRAYLNNPVEYIKSDVNRFSTIGKGQTWLMVACVFGDADIISFYRDYSQEYVNAKDCYGRTAFDYACMYNLDGLATLISTFGIKINQLNPQQVSYFTTFMSYIPYLGTYKRDELLKRAVERGKLPLVNALLSIGAQPTIKLAQKAQEKGYLKIMHRLLFSTLASIPEYKRDPYTTLSNLFK